MSVIYDLHDLFDCYQGQGYTIDLGALEQEFLDIQYQEVEPPALPKIIATTAYSNDTDRDQSLTFATNHSVAVAMEWTVTRGYKFGAEMSFRVGNPLVGGAATISYDLSVSTTAAQRCTTTEQWTWSFPILIPSRSKVAVTGVLNCCDCTVGFKARVQIRGYARLHSSPQDPQNHQYDVGDYFTKLPGKDPVKKPDWIQVVDQQTIVVEVLGRFRGIQGIDSHIDAKQTALA